MYSSSLTVKAPDLHITRSAQSYALDISLINALILYKLALVLSYNFNV